MAVLQAVPGRELPNQAYSERQVNLLPLVEQVEACSEEQVEALFSEVVEHRRRIPQNKSRKQVFSAKGSPREVVCSETISLEQVHRSLRLLLVCSTNPKSLLLPILNLR